MQAVSVRSAPASAVAGRIAAARRSVSAAALKKGDKLPAFTAKTSTGATITSEARIAKKNRAY